MSRYHQDRKSDEEPISYPMDHNDPNGDYWTWQEAMRAAKARPFLFAAKPDRQVQAQAILNTTTTAKDRHAAWAAVGRLIGRKL